MPQKHLVGVFFRTDRELNLKIKIAAFSEELSQQELINKALRTRLNITFCKALNFMQTAK